MGDDLQRPRHGRDGEDEARQQQGRQHGRQQAELEGHLLVVGESRDEGSPSEPAGQEQHGDRRQPEQRTADGHVEEGPRQEERTGSRHRGDQQVGQGLAQQQLDGPDRGGAQRLHGASLLLAHHREGGGDDRRHHQDEGHQAGDQEDRRFEVGVVPDQRRRLERRPDIDLVHQPGLRRDDLAGVSQDGVGHLGVGAVEDEEDRNGLPRRGLGGEIGRDDQRRLDGLGSEEGVQRADIVEDRLLDEEPALEKGLHDLTRGLGTALVHHREPDVGDVEAEGVAVDQQQDHRHREQGQCRPPVALELEEFLDRDGEDASDHVGDAPRRPGSSDEHILQRRLDRLHSHRRKAPVLEMARDRLRNLCPSDHGVEVAPNNAASSTPGRSSRSSRARAASRHSTSSTEPGAKTVLSRGMVSRASSFPACIRATRWQRSASSM